jgi:hypothetical protein
LIRDTVLDRSTVRTRHIVMGETRASSRLAVRLLAALLVVVAPLLLLEVLLRLTEDGRPWKRAFAEEGSLVFERPAAMHDLRTASRFTPNWSGRFYFDSDHEWVMVRANSIGFRSPEVSEDKPTGVRRVALIGDSLIAGLQVEPDVHYRALIEGALAERGAVQVMNFGLPGTGPVTHLHVYRDYARRFAPDAVVLGIYTDNDFNDNAHVAWRNDDGSLVDEPFPSITSQMGKVLKSNSCVVMAVWAFTKIATKRARPDPPPEPTDMAAIQAMRTSQLARVSNVTCRKTLAVWDELVREVQEDGVPVVIVLFPDKVHLTDHGWDYERLRTKVLHERLAEHFENQGVDVVTGSEMLARHTERYGSIPFPGWKNYLSREGHQSLATVLSERLAPLGGSARRTADAD